MESFESLGANYATAIRLIDDAHSQDPNTIPGDSGPIPYELHYARKMTRWLASRKPDASPALQLACRAQHFRRWELPRSSYPMTRAGYLTWRAKQKSQAAAQVAELLASSEIQPALARDEIERVAALVRKEGLTKGDVETQVLEDVACLVFLDDQFDGFEKKSEIDEEKVVGILRKTWAKMSEAGRKLALGMQLSERATGLIQKALSHN
ncbi:hypothetical protein N657DRAFT_641905 [Parathielavia appendiculata]|uniref:Glutamyl-tRNA synthetase n=1 Tax=Parathielavia appendiculata TaxID=2587402 RepID=A0AAN6Z866_9PEZI|nr:hypothetical protein N657DRAFT_641905 [Parathielavia appendiculata]